jgi:hypothetical protein
MGLSDALYKQFTGQLIKRRPIQKSEQKSASVHGQTIFNRRFLMELFEARYKPAESISLESNPRLKRGPLHGVTILLTRIIMYNILTGLHLLLSFCYIVV